MRKKGSLQLSINAIVVLVLAITILGLGIKFITDQFTTAQSTFSDVNQEMKDQIFEKLKTGELMTTLTTEIKLESGKPTKYYFGIRNTDNDQRKRFFIQFLCEGSVMNSEGCGNVYTDRYQWRWFDTFQYTDIQAGQTKAVYAKVQTQGAKNEYRGKLIAWVCNDTSTKCQTASEVCYNHTDIHQPYEVDASGNCDYSSPIGAKVHEMAKINVMIE